ncbi:MAG: hypothetical protein NWS22_05320, partial [Porticoccaceae bacterium]|nr:hypothetical protein [Porticoccaceae bacterium]
IDRSTVPLPDMADAIKAYVANISGVATIIAEPIPALVIRLGERKTASDSRAKNRVIGIKR